MDGVLFRDVVIVAAQGNARGPDASASQGQVSLDPPLVDPLPRWEDTRHLFRLTLSDQGVPFDPDRRLVLFGVVTSEDGPAVVTAFRLDF